MWLLFQCCFFYLFFLTNGQITVDTSAGAGAEGAGADGLHKMTFNPPALSEEDKHQVHMPEYLRCDGCKAVAYSIHKGGQDVYSLGFCTHLYSICQLI